MPDVIEVIQDGFRRGRRTWELADFPLFEVGKTYVMALTVPAPDWNQDRLVVLVGSLDRPTTQVSGPDDPAVAAYLAAVGNARYPDGFTPEFVDAQAEMVRAWLEAHPGYSSPGPASP